jgi:AcrR family transcriptional regulator
MDTGPLGVRKCGPMKLKPRKNDRRASRTRRALNDALIGLILEKRYDSITVQHVIDRANVGRSTFYAHYRDKEDLLRSSFEDFLGMFGSHMQWQNLKDGRTVPVLELFRHLQDFHNFYQALARSRKTDLLYKIGPSHMAKSIEQSLITWSPKLGVQQSIVPLPVLSHYLASALLAMLKWWLEQEMPYSPERMDEMFHALVLPGLRAALDNAPLDDAG